jgi:hypothetical protein
VELQNVSENKKNRVNKLHRTRGTALRKKKVVKCRWGRLTFERQCVRVRSCAQRLKHQHSSLFDAGHHVRGNVRVAGGGAKGGSHVHLHGEREPQG